MNDKLTLFCRENISGLNTILKEKEKFDAYMSCPTQQVVGAVLSFLFVANLVADMTLLRLFCKCGHLQTQINTFVAALTILNAVCNILQTPFLIASHFSCR